MSKPPPLPSRPPLNELPAGWADWLRLRPQAEQLIVFGWASQVAALVSELEGNRTHVFDDGSDQQVEFDYYAMLNDRDILEDEISALPAERAQELTDWLAAGPDLRFRDATEDVSARAALFIDEVEPQQGWWWQRVPRSGWMRQALNRLGARGG